MVFNQSYLERETDGGMGRYGGWGVRTETDNIYTTEFVKGLKESVE